VISIFHETKIRTVDMNVQVWTKLSKNKIPKKIKSPNFMKNGNFHTSKCRGKLEKMGALCTHSPKSPGPFPKLPKKKNSKKVGIVCVGLGIDLRPASDQRSPAKHEWEPET
jgi:hypothetical protein